MRSTVGSWVVEDDFFDREAELEALIERVQGGTHTLLTAQRRMGKTSLVRELLRRLAGGGQWKTIFVDLESAATPADAIAEIAFCSGAAQGMRGWFRRLPHLFPNVRLTDIELSPRVPGVDVKAKFRANVDAGNWRHKGDRVFAMLAGSGQVALALDEVAIFVNRMLKGNGDSITPEGKRMADEFLSWLRKNGQAHRGKVSMILTGSVGLEPILQQAGLSAHANIFSAFDLRPWDEQTAMACLAALAEHYRVDLPPPVCEKMCRLLRCQIPQHVQRFFDVLYQHLRRVRRSAASVDDVQHVYANEMLGVRGQMDMAHYEGRLRMVLGDEAYRVAFEMLTEAAVARRLSDEAIARWRTPPALGDPTRVDDVLHVLEHDGYLARQDGGYSFTSGLLEDWWRVRYGRSAAAPTSPSVEPGRSAQR